MRIDLHTHSDRSDGTDSPTQLVRRAARLGLDVVALTDHDTVDGWDEAADAAREVSLGLLPGIEISCSHQRASVHLLAYFPDPAYPPLRNELDRILAGRDARLPAILERLRGLGIDISVERVRRLAAPAAAVGRPHVADALVAEGFVADRDEAFERFLGPGRPAYVNRYAPDLRLVLGLVDGAGGVSVIAHPWARHSQPVLGPATLEELSTAGLTGIEVDHQDHDRPTRQRLRRLAGALGLVATGSSDYHGTGKAAHELGCNTTAPAQFDALMEAVRMVSSRAGRSAPQLASP